MPLPTNELTWQHNTNIVIGPTYTSTIQAHRSAWYNFKNALCTFASNAWTDCKWLCNSETTSGRTHGSTL